MDNSKVVERFQNGLKVVIDSYESKISDLETKIDVLESENRNLKSDIDYLECQNKVLRINNENFESDIMDYKERIKCLTQKN